MEGLNDQIGINPKYLEYYFLPSIGRVVKSMGLGPFDIQEIFDILEENEEYNKIDIN